MLKLKGNEIKNLNELKQNFDLDEILKWDQDFFRFANCHLAILNENNKRLCDWFRCALEHPVFAPIKVKEFQYLIKGEPFCQKDESVICLYSLCENSYPTNTKSVYIKGYSALLLSGMDVEIFVNEKLQALADDVKSVKFELFGEPSSYSLNKTKGCRYYKYDPDYQLQRNDKIRTILLVARDPMIRIVFEDERSDTKIEYVLKEGDKMFINVVQNTVVSILRNICENIMLPKYVSSSTKLHNGEYVYISNGQLRYSPNCHAVNMKWYDEEECFVEVATDKNDNLIVLTETGRVLSNLDIKEKVCSLSKILNQ